MQKSSHFASQEAVSQTGEFREFIEESILMRTKVKIPNDLMRFLVTKGKMTKSVRHQQETAHGSKKSTKISLKGKCNSLVAPVYRRPRYCYDHVVK